MRYLFQGDSVTDVGRNREDYYGLGAGYPRVIADYFAKAGIANAQVLNRGVSGDRVRDIKRRWQEDCLALVPDVVSILIGVNDTWRRYDSNDPTTAEAFFADYHDVLETTRKELPNTRIVLIEPFLLPINDERVRWHEDLDPKILAIRALAREFRLDLIPMDAYYAVACAHSAPEHFSADGVHPTPAGHALIAQKWLEIMGFAPADIA